MRKKAEEALSATVKKKCELEEQKTKLEHGIVMLQLSWIDKIVAKEDDLDNIIKKQKENNAEILSMSKNVGTHENNVTAVLGLFNNIQENAIDAFTGGANLTFEFAQLANMLETMYSDDTRFDTITEYAKGKN